MSDGADYVKYVTERVIRYWETPQSRSERRQKREHWLTRWFGQLLPVGIGIWWKGRKHNRRIAQAEPPHAAENPANYS